MPRQVLAWCKQPINPSFTPNTVIFRRWTTGVSSCPSSRWNSSSSLRVWQLITVVLAVQSRLDCSKWMGYDSRMANGSKHKKTSRICTILLPIPLLTVKNLRKFEAAYVVCVLVWICVSFLRRWEIKLHFAINSPVYKRN